MKYSEIIDSVYNQGIKPDWTTSERKVWEILEDLTDRKGLKQEWAQIDEDIKDEIFAEWVKIINRR